MCLWSVFVLFPTGGGEDFGVGMDEARERKSNDGKGEIDVQNISRDY